MGPAGKIESYNDLIQYRIIAEYMKKWLLRQERKGYIVKDGGIIVQHAVTSQSTIYLIWEKI
tara:strand:+ start:1166 stop:1351 length:186 start_codon:yes stop_codon:yes gene_type:complete